MASNALVVQAEQKVAPIMAMRSDIAAMVGSPKRAEKLLMSAKWMLIRAAESGNKAIFECTEGSLKMTAMTAVDLDLMMDPATGQFFALPFQQKGVWHAVPCIGYKGFNTLGAREGLTITGEVVYEGDAFELDLGTGYVSHRRPQGYRRDPKARIVGAWAKAAALDRPPIVTFMDIGEINALKERNPAVKQGRSTPWVTDFPAMAAKCPKRRLARSLPVGAFVRAARIEEAFEEQGKIAYSRAGEVIVGGSPQLLARERLPDVTTEKKPAKGKAEREPEKTPQLALEQPKPEGAKPLGTPKKRTFIFKIGRGPKQQKECHSIEQWRQIAVATILGLQGDNKYSAEEKLERVREVMGAIFDELAQDYPEHVAAVVNAIERRLKSG